MTSQQEYQRDYLKRPGVKERRRANYDARREQPGRLEDERWKARESWNRLLERQPLYGLWDACKKRARSRGRPCSITHDDLLQCWPEDDRCPDCGVVMQKGTGHAASVDEVVYGRGYIVGNVSIICKRCNGRKADGSLEWFERVARRIKHAEEAIR